MPMLDGGTVRYGLKSKEYLAGNMLLQSRRKSKLIGVLMLNGRQYPKVLMLLNVEFLEVKAIMLVLQEQKKALMEKVVNDVLILPNALANKTNLTKKSSGRIKASQILLFAKFAPLLSAAYFGVITLRHNLKQAF